jgi:murein L,D-transpeptidase YafK
MRSLLASAAVAAAVLLGGCDPEGGVVPTLRSLQPLSPQMIAEIERRNMSKESPVLIRIFKEESELEIWKEDQTGRMALLKTYPICRWSGDLGPKLREGDRQAPEGFYTITPSLMNPNSSYYLSINMGFPNAYDRSHGRTGAFLMIHGDCSSRGCYAMTDEQVAEIYALARESFFGGQGSFQIQAFPFRMTPQNMARHRNSPHMAFWKMLKVGYDHFEVTRQEPKVDVCERRYVFNTETKGRYNPAAACPALTTPDDLTAAVRDKQRRDDAQVAELIRRGNTGPAVRAFADGSMHPSFRNAVKPYNVDDNGVVVARISAPNGTIPANIRIPPSGPRTASHSTPASRTTTGSISEPVVRVESPGESRVAAAQPASGGGSGFFGNLFASGKRMVGISETAATEKAPTAPKAKPAPRHTARAKPAEDKKHAPKQSTNAGGIRPTIQETNTAASPSPAQAPQSSLASGGQPAASGGFDNRFGAWR